MKFVDELRKLSNDYSEKANYNFSKYYDKRLKHDDRIRVLESCRNYKDFSNVLNYLIDKAIQERKEVHINSCSHINVASVLSWVNVANERLSDLSYAIGIIEKRLKSEN